MIFDAIRTRRLSVQLVELTLDEAIDLCKLPVERHERATTELLKFVARNAAKLTDDHVTDPLLWSVEERMLVVAMYIAAVAADGPNFAVSNVSKLSDYLDLTRDLPIDDGGRPVIVVNLGEVAGKERVMRPLLGVHAQALEALYKTRGQWVLGAIACQMFKADEVVPDWLSVPEIELREWIDKRVTALRKAPESKVAEVYSAWEDGAAELSHFFGIAFDAKGGGLMCVPNREGEAGAELPSARFRPVSCISTESKFLSV